MPRRSRPTGVATRAVADAGSIRAVNGGNLGIGKSFFEALGGFDERFDRHGGEDTEFG